jgi:hypothetical protein
MIKILSAIYTRFSFFLNRKTELDGRLLLLLFVALYFLPIIVTAPFLHNSEQWKNLWWVFPGVPKMWPSFRDLRVITSGYECYRLGYEPRIENPCDPYVPPMPMNYPKIWLYLANFGINQSHTVLIGVAIGILFLLMVFLVIKRLNYTEAVIYALILFSPSVMLGIERGNNDLIIFSLLSIALFFVNGGTGIHRVISGSIVLFSALLKLFPILTILVFVREKKKIFLITASLIIALFIVYFTKNFNDIRLVSSATLKGVSWSYGWNVTLSLLKQDFLISRKILFPALLVIILIGLRIIWANLKHVPVVQCEQYFIDAFRMGAVIYIGSFLLIGNNWAYRLIFLIFTIPQILSWIKETDRPISLPGFSLAGIILTMWFKTVGEYGNPNRLEKLLMYFSQVIDWFLLFFFIYALLLTLPNWLKPWASGSRSKISASC